MKSLFGITLVWLMGSLAAMGQNALLVVRNPALNAGDTFLNERLVDNGFEVTVVGQDASAASDADGMDLVVISETVFSDRISSKYRDTLAGVIVLESFVLDDMNVTGRTTDVDLGLANVDSIIVTNSQHPLAAGLEGTVQILETTATVTWAKPSENAAKVALLADDVEGHYGIFGYEAGAQMVGLQAPGRRVQLPFHNAAVQAGLTDDGVKILEAAFQWAAGLGADPDIALPESFQFGQLPTSPRMHARTLTIGNAGQTKDLEIANITLSGADSDHFTITGGAGIIAPGGQREVPIVFDSKDETGAFRATIEITSDDPDAADQVKRFDLTAQIVNLNGPIAHFPLDEAADETMIRDASGFLRDGQFEAGPSGSITLGETALASGAAAQISGGAQALSLIHI